MNVQAHISGQLSEQSPNQGTVPQDSGNPQMQNIAVASAGGGGGGGEGPLRSTVGHIDHDILRLRRYMQILVFKVLQQKQPSPDDPASKAKYMDVARRLEDGLFKTANTKEEYLNESTLESRLASLIKGRPTTTGGLSHAGGNPSSMVTPSACASLGLGPSRNTVVPVDPDVLELREHMRTLVLSELHKRQPCPANDASKAIYLDVARRLEEALFKTAISKEDYLNQSTLNSRLATLIRGRKLDNQQNANSSPPALAPDVITMVGEEVPENEDDEFET